MRIWLVIAVLGSSLTAAADPRDLDANEIHAQLEPFAGAIEHCYVDRTAAIYGAGHLELVLAVSRYGIVERVDVNTPGLPAKLAKDVDTCIRAAIAPVSFPAKRTTTTVTVPYFFQRTAAPNAGPQLSCWNPRGCHHEEAAKARQARENRLAANARSRR
jgi:hypothetical protein